MLLRKAEPFLFNGKSIVVHNPGLVLPPRADTGSLVIIVNAELLSKEVSVKKPEYPKETHCRLLHESKPDLCIQILQLLRRDIRKIF